MKKIAIITTHPIQYNAPFFKMLHQRKQLIIKVYYTGGEEVLQSKFDQGFAKNIEWDIPLLEGYDYVFVKNVSTHPGTYSFKGIHNPTLIDEIRDWGADALLVYGWNFKSHLKAMRYFHGKLPVFFRGDSTLLDERKNIFKVWGRRIFLKWVYHYVDKAFYVGTANKNYFLKHGLASHQLCFLPHVIDNDRFLESPKKDFRNILQIPQNNLVFLYAGKFEKKKNIHLLIDAFSEIQSSGVTLVLAGSGPCEGELRNQVAALNDYLKSRIYFLDFQNQSLMPSLYSFSDVFVLPSKGPGETWGLCINEAMACGKAVLVSSSAGSALDLVIEGENGYVFESENKTDLLNKLNRFVENTELIKTMGLASKKIISNWNYQKKCDLIESYLINNSKI